MKRFALVPKRREPHLGPKPRAPGIVTELVRGGYDAVIAFPSLGPLAAMAVAAARLRRSLGAPRLRTLLWVFDLVQYLEAHVTTFPDEARVRGWLWTPHPLKRRYRQAWLRAFDGLFSINATECRLLRDVVPFCALVPVCVDPAEFATAASAERGAAGGLSDFDGIAPETGELRIGCVSRITPHKGQDVAIRAFAAAHQRLPQGARLVVAGAVYDEQYYRSLQRLTAELGLEGEVLLRRDLSRSDILGIYAACDLHLVPVRFMSAGAIIQEAWAAGKAVIQSDRIDPNILREGVDGITFRYPCEEELADCMVELAADPVRLRSLGSAGRERVERVFNYQRQALTVEMTLERMIAGPLGAGEAREVEALAWDGAVPEPPRVERRLEVHA